MCMRETLEGWSLFIYTICSYVTVAQSSRIHGWVEPVNKIE